MSGSKGDGQVFFDRMIEHQLLFIGFCESAGWIDGQCGQLASRNCYVCNRLVCSDCQIKTSEGSILCGQCETTGTGQVAWSSTIRH